MATYIVRRLLLLIPIIIVVAIVAFLITNVMPGDPVRLMLGNFATERQIAAMRAILGLDRPLYIRFGLWAAQIIRGNLGESLFLHEPVTTAIESRMEPTLLLAAFGQLFAVLFGIPLGVIAAVKHRTIVDQAAIGVSLLGISVPSFWLSIILILYFGVDLRWFPVAGYVPLAQSGFGVIRYLALPGLALGLMQSGLLARMTRSAMLDVLQQDYIRTARAKGLAEKIVIARHALKNALIPVTTVLGFSLANLLAGTWVIETVFAIPGTGALAILAIMERDYPVIQGTMLFVAMVYVLVNLLVDISYALINPAVKYR